MAADVDREMKTRKNDLLDKELERFMENALGKDRYQPKSITWMHV
jgi:hypothetical protein